MRAEPRYLHLVRVLRVILAVGVLMSCGVVDENPEAANPAPERASTTVSLSITTTEDPLPEGAVERDSAAVKAQFREIEETADCSVLLAIRKRAFFITVPPPGQPAASAAEQALAGRLYDRVVEQSKKVHCRVDDCDLDHPLLDTLAGCGG